MVKIGEVDILNDIRDHVILIKLMDIAGNLNHAIIITGRWINDSNHRRALSLMK